jgi:hypothetical protein
MTNAPEPGMCKRRRPERRATAEGNRISINNEDKYESSIEEIFNDEVKAIRSSGIEARVLRIYFD